MKKFVIVILCLSNIALGDCNWASIKTLPNGNYEYTPTLHLCVGKLVQDGKVKDTQIQDLTKAIQLKDLALTASDSRAKLWMDTSLSEQDRLMKIDSAQKQNNFLYFGLGILASIGVGMTTARLIGR